MLVKELFRYRVESVYWTVVRGQDQHDPRVRQVLLSLNGLADGFHDVADGCPAFKQARVAAQSLPSAPFRRSDLHVEDRLRIAPAGGGAVHAPLSLGVGWHDRGCVPDGAEFIELFRQAQSRLELDRLRPGVPARDPVGGLPVGGG